MSTDALTAYLTRIPGLTVLSTSDAGSNPWWVKIKIDIRRPLAWNIVQELAHVLNDLSVTEKLPTTFYPTSPPPYLNGGPETYLSWVIESRGTGVAPERIAEVLEGRLPRPVEDVAQWPGDDE